MTGRVVAVTGAAGGIGSALCRRLATDRCRLGLLGRTRDKLQALADELRARGTDASVQVCDMRDRAAVTAALDAVRRDLGPIDVLIHNAGVARTTVATSPDLDDFQEMLDVNYLGCVYAVSAVLAGMIERGRGQIVAVSSLAARRGMAWSGGYSASKAAMNTYLESLRPALRKRGILVTTAFLGFVRTPMSEALDWGTWVPMASPDAAARHVLRAAAKGRRETSYPLGQALMAGVLRRLPPWAFDAFMATLGRLTIKGEY